MKPKAAAATALSPGGGRALSPNLWARPTEGVGGPEGPTGLSAATCGAWGGAAFCGRHRAPCVQQRALPCPAWLPAGGGMGGDHWSRLAMPDAWLGAGPAASCPSSWARTGPAPASVWVQLCRSSGPWGRVAVAAGRLPKPWRWAASLERPLGASAWQQGGHQPAAQEQPDRSRRGAEWRGRQEAAAARGPRGWAEYPRARSPRALQPTQPRVAASPLPGLGQRDWGRRQEPRRGQGRPSAPAGAEPLYSGD